MSRIAPPVSNAREGSIGFSLREWRCQIAEKHIARLEAMNDEELLVIATG